MVEGRDRSIRRSAMKRMAAVAAALGIVVPGLTACGSQRRDGESLAHCEMRLIKSGNYDIGNSAEDQAAELDAIKKDCQ